MSSAAAIDVENEASIGVRGFYCGSGVQDLKSWGLADLRLKITECGRQGLGTRG